jgi:hypothetical protein
MTIYSVGYVYICIYISIHEKTRQMSDYNEKYLNLLPSHVHMK